MNIIHKFLMISIKRRLKLYPISMRNTKKAGNPPLFHEFLHNMHLIANISGWLRV